jgi:hypothetical protein
VGDLDLTDIRLLIIAKQKQILRRTNNGIHEHINFKKIVAILNSYKEQRPFNGMVTLLFEIAELESLLDNASPAIFSLIDKCILDAYNHIVVDRDCTVISNEKKNFSGSNEARRIYTELSKEFCVFVLKETGVHYFANGDDVGEIIFFTKEDEERFKELKNITQLGQLFEEYRIKLTIRDHYHKFFASNSHKKALYQLLGHGSKAAKFSAIKKKKALDEFLKSKTQLLENKPEDRFREDLRSFLDLNLKGQVIITKEHLLESFKRIDILITDEYGDLYLIEVKWVGTSIHADGSRLGTSYLAKDINPDAVIQTINYLIELSRHKKDIKIGYLAVFDARENDNPDTLEPFDSNSVLNTDQMRFFPRFKKITDFKVVNDHPN